MNAWIIILLIILAMLGIVEIILIVTIAKGILILMAEKRDEDENY